ncbi:MAG TPA: uracil-DNA glycosylase [Vicinamibacterales bacterium]|nr:uracil-DNA glycosylase [Vicinamibacterales bacterium]
MSLTKVHHDIVTCSRCERLRTYCTEIARVKRAAFRNDTYWAKPVPGFGDPAARVLILGLAPAAHGANRTGRVFTGDGGGGSGDFLMAALHRNGFANIPTSQSIEDGLRLKDAFIAAAVRCAPPDNKPTPDEILACQAHLEAELAQLPNVRVVVALGKIAFDAWWRVMAAKGFVVKPRPPFSHGVVRRVAGAPVVIGAYHPSRQNTNTGKLTARMMDSIFRTAAKLVANPKPKA